MNSITTVLSVPGTTRSRSSHPLFFSFPLFFFKSVTTSPLLFVLLLLHSILDLLKFIGFRIGRGVSLLFSGLYSTPNKNVIFFRHFLHYSDLSIRTRSSISKNIYSKHPSKTKTKWRLQFYPSVTSKSHFTVLDWLYISRETDLSTWRHRHSDT